MTHHGEFEVTVIAVCHRETETSGEGGTQGGGRTEVGNIGKTRKKEMKRKEGQGRC